MQKRRVVVTGATGKVAAQVLEGFGDGYDLVLLDVASGQVDGGSTVHAVDLSDPEIDRYRHHFKGADAVVHLAHRRTQGSWHDPLLYLQQRVNVDMAFNVYRTALEEGVRRVVMASSNHASDWYVDEIRQGRRDAIDPWEKAYSHNFYGWSKDAYEHMGFVFACGSLGRPLEVVLIRIGSPRELGPGDWEQGGEKFKKNLGSYVSARDLAQLFVRSVETPEIPNRDLGDVPFHIFYGVSDNTRRYWNIANARQVVGYAPEDDSEVRYADAIHEHLTKGADGTPGRI